MIRAAMIAALFGFLVTPVNASGPYTDELAKCLVMSTSDENKTMLVRWMFAMASLHPDVSELSAVSEPRRSEIYKETALLFQTLLTETCVKEARAALKYEGQQAITASFEVLGSVAGRALFSDPKVAASMTEFDKYVDSERLQKLLEPQDE